MSEKLSNKHSNGSSKSTTPNGNGKVSKTQNGDSSKHKIKLSSGDPFPKSIILE